MHNKIMKLALYAVCLNVFFTPFNGGIAALFGYLTIICCFIYPVAASRKKGELKISLQLFIMIVAMIVSMIMSIDYFTPNEIERYIIASCSFVSFYWSLSINDKSNKTLSLNDIYIPNYILCFIYILFAFGPFDFKYTLMGEWMVPVFTLGLGNPNGVSVYVMFSFVVLLVQVITVNSKVQKAFNFILMGLLLYILIMLSSRTVLFCALAILAYFVIRPRKKIGKFFPYLVMVVPILMVPIQEYIGKNFLSINILDKSLATGRDVLYEEVINEAFQSPSTFLFGQFFKHSFDNMHNTPLTILASMGVIGLVGFTVFWIRQINSMSKNVATRTQIVATVAVLAFIIHSSSETMTMVGTVPYGLLVLLIVKIAKGEIKEEG